MVVGAGGEAKRWAMDRWVELAARLRGAGEVRLIAGPVERERFAASERAMFEAAGGEFVSERGGLGELADVIRHARGYVGCDTGPTHLAAQMGVATVALFGPTDAAVWGPVGARVRVIAPATRMGMEWLTVRIAEGAAIDTNRT